MRVVLRIGRSRSIWDESIDEILRKSFVKKTGELDLTLSVYLVSSDEIVRAVAEHVVSETLPNFAASSELDLTDLAPVTPKPGKTAFKFTCDHHAELLLTDEAELKGLIERVKNEPRRRLDRDREALWDYVLACEARGDEEWLNLLARDDKRKWRELIEKKKTKRQPAPTQ